MPPRVSPIWPFAFGLAALLLCWFTIERHGLGMSIDAITYVSTARNLLEGRGYYDSVQEPVAAWGPMFPTLLAAIGLLGIDPLASAAWVNPLAYASIVGLASDVLRRTLAAPLLFFLGSALCLAAAPLFLTSIFAFSEPTFTLASFVSVLALERWIRGHKGLWFAVAAIAAALAWTGRYIGLVSLVTGAAIVLMHARTTLFRKLHWSAGFAAIAAVPTALWLARNYQVTGTLTGGRGESSHGILETVASALTGVAGWVCLERFPYSAWIGALILAAIGAAWLFAHRRDAIGPAFMPLATYLCAFLGLIVVASSSTHSLLIPGRLIAPAYVVFVLVAVITVDAVVASFSSRLGLAGAALLMVPWLLAQGAVIVKTVDLARSKGLPYTEHAWKDVQMIAFLRENPLRGEVWSNDPWAVYRFTGIHARIAPRPFRGFMPLEKDHGLDDFQARVAQGGENWLVWFTITRKSWIHTLPEIRAAVESEVVGSFPEGAVYRLRPR
ncbi:MAG: hypothetical protein ACKVXR_02505 [Planctomycetota bacterium]